MSLSLPTFTTGTCGLFGEYRPVPQIYDESATADLQLREHWRFLAGTLDRLGREEIASRADNARRIVRENGVTYNIYGDPQGTDRAWELDLLPLLISPQEWARIERGLAQRAKLLNLILNDIYGPQHLLRTGALPPSLVYASPAFLRACHGVRVPGNVYLHLHAADLARSPDGQWWVLADRTQAPSGAGYALENRMVLSRVLPEEYKHSQVQRLAPFFAKYRDNLRSLAPVSTNGNPHIVLLTPGPYNETYFEHAYLARYLGFTLVEGGDLTVRDTRVYLKTLEGLQRVDVILRRVDDVFCDPLELRGDSFLGVPGLLQATRAEEVTIANAIGSTLIESPAFLAFLPGLCRTLLGEDLILPSIATWWCGQAREQRHVVENLDRIVVKPAFAPFSQLPFFGRQLSSSAREKLIAEINRQPFAFVGHEQVAFSTAPVWVHEKLEPRGVVVRLYTTALGDSYSVMPGGLTRTSSRAGDPVISMQSGGGSKDTWILSDAPVAPVTLLTPAGQPASAVPVSTEVPSRVADNLFWMGRYAERLEGNLRLLRCTLSRMSDEVSPEAEDELIALIEILVFTKRIPKHFASRVDAQELEHEILQLVYNSRRAGSVRELVLRLRQMASTVRDRLSADTWRILNQLQLDTKTRPGRLRLANAMSICNTLIVDLAAFSGMEMENMTRGHGWRFLDFGRRLERAFTLIEIVRSALLMESSRALSLPPLLEFADSTITFRRRYFAEPRFSSVLELLFGDRGNPRSLAFQFAVLRDHAQYLPGSPEVSSSDSILQHLNAIVTRAGHLPLIDVDSGNEEIDRLAKLLGVLSRDLSALSDRVTEHYFCHTISHQVAG